MFFAEPNPLSSVFSPASIEYTLNLIEEDPQLTASP